MKSFKEYVSLAESKNLALTAAEATKKATGNGYVKGVGTAYYKDEVKTDLMRFSHTHGSKLKQDGFTKGHTLTVIGDNQADVEATVKRLVPSSAHIITHEDIVGGQGQNWLSVTKHVAFAAKRTFATK